MADNGRRGGGSRGAGGGRAAARCDRKGYPLGYRPYLDGLRGIAVLAVIAYHGRSGLLPGGFLGVDMFFALSGFLITALLIREYDAFGRIDLRQFYIRRILRIVPAFGLLIAAFVGAAMTLGIDRHAVVAEAAAAGLYVSNWTIAFGFDFPVYLVHSWSLAIEEQFYLIWPVVMGLLLSRRSLRGALAVILTVIVLVLIWRSALHLSGAAELRVYAGFDTRVDALLMGAALACVATLPRSEGVARLLDNAVKALPAVLCALVLALLFAKRGHLAMSLTGYSFAAFATALSICVVMEGKAARLRAVLEFAPLVLVGRISYGLYLWHYAIFKIMFDDLGYDAVLVNTAGIALAFALAAGSYVFVERPILRFKRRYAAGDAVRRGAPRWPSPHASRPGATEVAAPGGQSMSER